MADNEDQNSWQAIIEDAKKYINKLSSDNVDITDTSNYKSADSYINALDGKNYQKSAYETKISNLANTRSKLDLYPNMINSAGDWFKRTSTTLSSTVETAAKDMLSGVAKDIISPITEKDPVVYYNSKDIGIMMDSGPDSAANAFDIYFLLQQTYTLETSPLQLLLAGILGNKNNYYDVYKYFSNFADPRVFGVHVQNINIPQIKSNTSAIKFLSRQIIKQKTKPDFSHKSTFTLRMDENLFLLDLINAMSGHRQLLSDLDDINSTSNVNLKSLIINNHDVSEIWGKFRSQETEYELSDLGLCIMVKMRNLSTPDATLKKNGIIDINSTSNLIADKDMPYFIFEGVKILGTDSAISFSNTNSNPTTMTINFTFRRLNKVVTTKAINTSKQGASLKDYIDIKNIYPVLPNNGAS